MSEMPILSVDLPNVREYIKDENFCSILIMKRCL